MRTFLIIDTATGDDVELDHEDIQTIRDVLEREQARAVKMLGQFPPRHPQAEEQATIEELTNREKVYTWSSMIRRVLTKLG